MGVNHCEANCTIDITKRIGFYCDNLGASITSSLLERISRQLPSFLKSRIKVFASLTSKSQVKKRYRERPAKEEIPVSINKLIVFVVSKTSLSKSFIGTYNAI